MFDIFLIFPFFQIHIAASVTNADKIEADTAVCDLEFVATHVELGLEVRLGP